MSDPLNILVVNVRADAVRALGELLHQRGHRVSTADGALEAVARAHRLSAAGDRLTLVMADLELPEMDALSMLAELRRRGETCDFAVLTGPEGLPMDQVTRARHLGCDQVLKRPYSAAQLDQVLETALGRRDGRIPPPGNQDPAPFFGTTRVFRAARQRAASELPPPAAPEPALDPVAVPPPAPRAPARDPIAPELFFGDDDQPPSPSLLDRTPARPVTPPPIQRSNGATRTFRSPVPEAAPPQPGTGALRRGVVTPPPNSSAATPGGGTASFRAGTGAVARPGTAPAARPPSGYERQRSDPFLAARPRATETTTARIRRGVDGNRPDTGAHAHPPPPAAAGLVTCPMCQRTFQAALRSAAYTTLCVHCGQLVRVEPG